QPRGSPSVVGTGEKSGGPGRRWPRPVLIVTGLCPRSGRHSVKRDTEHSGRRWRTRVLHGAGAARGSAARDPRELAVVIPDRGEERLGADRREEVEGELRDVLAVVGDPDVGHVAAAEVDDHGA